MYNKVTENDIEFLRAATSPDRVLVGDERSEDYSHDELAGVKAMPEVLVRVLYTEEVSKIIAEKRGIKIMSSQAVGGAVGWNPICIIIPCHRVVGINGSLTGYGGGIKNKIELLKLEGNDISKYHVPKRGTAL